MNKIVNGSHSAAAGLLLLLAVLMSGTIHSGERPPRIIRLGLSRSPAALPVLRIVEERLLGDGVDFKIDVWTAPEQLLAMAQGGDHDLFTLPANLAATMYNKGIPVRMTNVNTWGATYFVTTDPNVNRWEDLADEAVYFPPASSPPETLARYFLDKAGMTGSVEIRNLSIPEVANLMRAKRIRHAALIEPALSAAQSGNGDIRVVFDFEEEWRKIWGPDAELPSICFGGTAAFVDANAEFVAAFETAYAESLDWVLRHPDETGKLAEKHLGVPAEAVSAAVPRMGLRYRRASEAQDDLLRYYRVFLEFAPTTIGGAVPDENLYR